MSKFKIEFLTRQLGIIPVEKLDAAINVIGAGAIGSHTVMALARMGFSNITVWDDDEVSEMNMNCQGYDIEDIGQPKVECLASKVNKAIGFTIKTNKARWEKENLGGIVIAAVDNMKTRSEIFKQCTNATFLIDPRMGAEVAALYVVQRGLKEHEVAYPKSLCSDEDAVREPCTAKSTVYTAYLISGLVVKAVKDIVTGAKYTKTVDWDIKNNGYTSWLQD